MVQNRTDYIKTALEHLNDPVTYMVLDGDPTLAICSNINRLLKNFHNKGLLNKDMVAFCSPPKKVRPARFYLLNKIHKNPMGIHPIVSSCDSATENISQFIDYWLQPIMKSLPSYLKDTLQLINELKEISVEPDTILVTVDVKSLYTCIPHDEGIAACKEALNSTLESNPDRPDISILICLLEIVLKNNTFEFDNKFYKQLQGTAMGTKLAPAYANIFMGKLEHDILSQAPLKPSFYKRYIDDILIYWPHSELQLNDFLFSMNTFHPSIKFTSEISHERISYLDLNIYKGPNFLSSRKLDIETHIKPTNRQAYIHANSYHPPGVSKGVALGEMKRYLRTNSRVETFNTFKAKHKVNLRKRGYSHKFINHFTNQVKFLDRSFELSNKKVTKRLHRIPFVTRFTPSAHLALQIINKYWPHLQHLQQFKHINIPRPMLSFKTNRNIKSYLVKSKLTQSLDCHNETTPLNNFPLDYTSLRDVL